MASSDARPVPQKNVAYRVTFPIFDADGDLVSSAAGLDSEVSKDGGAFSDCTSEATEIGSSGMYYLDLTNTEMNADTVAIIIQTSTSGAKTTPIVLYPEEAGDIRVNVTQLGSSTQSATDLKDFADDGYDPSTDKVQGVVLVDTTTTNTDMAGTDNAALASALTTAQNDLDILTGADGATLATSQPNYAPATASALTTHDGKLDTVDTVVDAIKAKTDNLPADPASETNVDANETKIDTLTTNVGNLNNLSAAEVNAEVDTALNTAIPGLPTANSINERVKAIDDKLPSGTISDFDESSNNVDLNADQSSVTIGTVTTNTDMRGTDNAATAVALATAQADLDNPGQYKADVSGLATASALTTVDTVVDAIKAKTDNLPDGISKNTALNNFEFFMTDASDDISGKTGLTITATRSIDGAAFAACTNLASEVSGGVYKINLSASDLNGDVITFKFSGTGANDRLITLVTQT
jgi:hypothetical protein